MAAIDLGADRLLKLREVRDMTGLGTTTIYRKMHDREFPRPLHLGRGTVRWRLSTLVEWMDSLKPTGPDQEPPVDD